MALGEEEHSLDFLQVRIRHITGFFLPTVTNSGFAANVDASSIQGEIKRLQDGVYFGYARVVGGDGHAEPMVMSIGQNVTFDATHKTVVRSIASPVIDNPL